MERGSGRGVLERTSLCGRGEEILILVVAESTPAQLTDWLKLPLELSRSGDAFLLDRNQCCNVRHKGEELLLFVMARATDEQWCRWLRIPLEHAVVAGKALLVKPLLAAGAGLGAVVGKGSAATRCAGDVAGVETPAAATVATVDGISKPGSCCGSGSSSKISGGGGSRCGRVASSPSCSLPSPFSSSSSSQETVAVPDAESTSSCCSKPPVLPPSPASGCRGDTQPSSTPLVPEAKAAGAVLLASPHCSAPSTSPSPGGDCCGGYEYPVPGAPCPEAKAAAAAAAAAARAAACVIADPLCLHRATMARDVARMRELLAAGVDRNAIDLWECTALHRAAEQDDSAEPVRLLLAAGLDVGARDMEGYTALHFAAARGAETAIIDLLAAGSCLADRGNNGDSPLHSAVRFLSVATVRILLESDADEAARNKDGETPADVTGVLPDGRDIENQPDPLVAQRILELLEAAPQRRRDRVWRRRGWIVMMRARAQAQAARELAEAARTGCLVVLRSESSLSDGGAGGGGGGADGGDPEECCEGAGDRGGGGGGGDSGGGGGIVSAVAKGTGLAELVEQTTLLAEEGVFQKVVGFL
ncbi:unnamed protein product [Hapterophycus canaliculatus]